MKSPTRPDHEPSENDKIKKLGFGLFNIVYQTFLVNIFYFLLVAELVRGNQAKAKDIPQWLATPLLYNLINENPSLMIFIAYPLHQFLMYAPKGLWRMGHFLTLSLQCRNSTVNSEEAWIKESTDNGQKSLYEIAKEYPTYTGITLPITALLSAALPGIAFFEMGANGAALVSKKLFKIVLIEGTKNDYGSAAAVTNLFLYWYPLMHVALKLRDWVHNWESNATGPKLSWPKFFKIVFMKCLIAISLFNSSPYMKNGFEDTKSINATNHRPFDSLKDSSAYGIGLWIMEACLLYTFIQACFYQPIAEIKAITNTTHKLAHCAYKATILGVLSAAAFGVLPWPTVFIATFMSSVQQYVFNVFWPQTETAPNTTESDPLSNSNSNSKTRLLSSAQGVYDHPNSPARHEITSSLILGWSRLPLLLSTIMVIISSLSSISITLSKTSDTGSSFLTNFEDYFTRTDARAFVVPVLALIGAGSNMMGLTNIFILLMAMYTSKRESNAKNKSPELPYANGYSNGAANANANGHVSLDFTS